MLKIFIIIIFISNSNQFFQGIYYWLYDYKRKNSLFMIWIILKASRVLPRFVETKAIASTMRYRLWDITASVKTTILVKHAIDII